MDKTGAAATDNADNSIGVGGQRMALRERPRSDRQLRSRDDRKFLEDFDPEKSNREKRKLKRKIGGPVNGKAATPYDEYGCLRHNGKDVCDCMGPDCVGCWFPCENCGSTKCGVQCRVNRKFCYESICYDGKDGVIRNMNYPPK